VSTEEKYELFEAYLDNSLSAEERISFDALMKDANNKIAFEEYKAIQDTFITLQKNESNEKDFIANVKNIASAYKNTASEDATENDEETISKASSIEKSTTQQATKTLGFSKNIKWTMGIAAALVIGLFTFKNFILPKQSTTELLAYHYNIDNLSLERGSANDSLEKIVSFYNDNKFQEILPMLQAYSSTHTENGDLKLAVAICNIEIKDFAKAEGLLQNIISEKSVYQQKAEWFLAMCYLKQNKIDECKTLLKSFEDDHFYKAKAKDILKAL
jgi:hypothetical protein